MSYPIKPSSLAELSSLTLHYYCRALLNSFIYILIFVGVENFLGYWDRNFNSPWFLSLLFTLAGALVTILLLGLVIERIDSVIRDAQVSIKESGMTVLKRILPIYAACFLIVIATIIWFLLVRWGAVKLLHSSPLMASLATIFGVGLPLIIVLMNCYFVIPLILLQQNDVLTAFKNSFYLAGKHIGMMLFLYVCMVVIFILLAPTAKHTHWLNAQHLNLIFDAVVLCITIPLLTTLSLLLLNDMQVKEHTNPPVTFKEKINP